MDSNLNNENDHWELSLDIDDSDLNLTPSGSWVSATDYVNANGGTMSGCLGDIKNYLKNEKLDQVVAIVKSCSPNALGDLTVTIKDLPCTIHGTIHYKVIGEGGYGKYITVGAALILANVLVFSPKPSMHYLNIIKKNVVKVFRKDTVSESGSTMDNKTNQCNPPTPEKPTMPPISSYPTVKELAEEHDIGDEYLTEGYLTEKEQHQLALDEETLRETLKEEAWAEKERARAEKEWEEEMKKEQAHDELFRLEFGVKSDSEYESD
ncbi:hypothetical protein Tco_1101671 [Tanacetum coccineum]